MTFDIQAENWGWRHASRRAWAVRHVNFHVDAGERVLLLGASGSGKSTLLAALAGVLGDANEGEEEGLLTISGTHPRNMRGHAALMMQDPDSQTILHRVGDDVAFGCENMCVPPDEIWPRVDAALNAVGLDLARDHPTNHLSGGERQRLVLAGALAMGAELLVLDEPTSNLDSAGILQVRAAVAEAVADRTRTLIVVEHHCEVWSPLVDRVIVLTPEGIAADGPPDLVFPEMGTELAAMGVWVPEEYASPRTGADNSPTLRDDFPSQAPILSTTDLSIGYGTTVVRTGLALDIPMGQSTLITGPNGSGKTTLALTLAGLLTPLDGHVDAATSLAPTGRPHPHTWKSRELLTRIGTVFQSPDHQFVASTVFDEITVGLRALKLDSAQIKEKVTRLLDQLRLSHLGQANPFTLSGGEKRRLSVAGVLACNPSVVVLDEPTFGQDRLTWAGMIEIVRTLRDEGTTVISVTHDPQYIEALGDHRIDMGQR